MNTGVYSLADATGSMTCILGAVNRVFDGRPRINVQSGMLLLVYMYVPRVALGIPRMLQRCLHLTTWDSKIRNLVI